MKKLLFIFTMILLSLNAMAADAQKEHTVERGETLSSIAKLYNVTTDALLKANPIVKEMFYTGMVLVIPEPEINATEQTNTQQTTRQYPVRSSDSTILTAETTDNSTEGPKCIDGWFVSYNASFDSFRYGWYGFGWQTFNENGFGGTFTVHGNWGLVDEGNIMFKFGPAYASQVHENIFLGGSLRGFMYSYDVYDKSGKSDLKLNGGITVTPSIYLSFNKLFIGFGYELGWCNKWGELYHDAQFIIGLNI